MEKNKLIEIASLKMPKKYQSPDLESHWSCDLHPRWDRNFGIVCFDSVYNNNRNLCTVNLTKALTELSKGNELM